MFRVRRKSPSEPHIIDAADFLASCPLLTTPTNEVPVDVELQAQIDELFQDSYELINADVAHTAASDTTNPNQPSPSIEDGETQAFRMYCNLSPPRQGLFPTPQPGRSTSFEKNCGDDKVTPDSILAGTDGAANATASFEGSISQFDLFKAFEDDRTGQTSGVAAAATLYTPTKASTTFQGSLADDKLSESFRGTIEHDRTDLTAKHHGADDKLFQSFRDRTDLTAKHHGADDKLFQSFRDRTDLTAKRHGAMPCTSPMVLGFDYGCASTHGKREAVESAMAGNPKRLRTSGEASGVSKRLDLIPLTSMSGETSQQIAEKSPATVDLRSCLALTKSIAIDLLGKAKLNNRYLSRQLPIVYRLAAFITMEVQSGRATTDAIMKRLKKWKEEVKEMDKCSSLSAASTKLERALYCSASWWSDFSREWLNKPSFGKYYVGASMKTLLQCDEQIGRLEKHLDDYCKSKWEALIESMYKSKIKWTKETRQDILESMCDTTARFIRLFRRKWRETQDCKSLHSAFSACTDIVTILLKWEGPVIYKICRSGFYTATKSRRIFQNLQDFCLTALKEMIHPQMAIRLLEGEDHQVSKSLEEWCAKRTEKNFRGVLQDIVSTNKSALCYCCLPNDVKVLFGTSGSPPDDWKTNFIPLMSNRWNQAL